VRIGGASPFLAGRSVGASKGFFVRGIRPLRGRRGLNPQSPARLESGLFAVGGPAGFCTVTYRADVPVCSFRLQGGALLRECHVVETACSSRSRCHSSGNGMARNICPV
jgi:hypothetical protein